MANSALLSDSTTSYEFVYDSASQDDFKLRYGMSVTAGEPNVLWHRPDNSPPQLVRITNDLTTIFLTTIVYGDDWDDVINTLAPIKRWVDGDDQQAARYHSSGDVNKIFARIQLDGMTNYTDWTILYGNVDDSKAYYTVVADRNKLAVDVVLMLTCESVGNGASFTMRNDLASSPHFIEDSDSDGVADGWAETGTVNSSSINTTSWLIGGASQFFNLDSSNRGGVIADDVTASISSSGVAYAWVRADNDANDPLTIRLSDGSGNIIDDATFDPSSPTGYDKTAIGSNNRPWYRYVVSGTNSSAANFRFIVQRLAADASMSGGYFVDAAYLYVGSTTAPDGWCSTGAIQNRYDPTSSAEGRINYVDVWGIPGDANAIIDTTISNSGNGLIVSVNEDGKFPAVDSYYWIDSVNMSSGGGSNWTSTTDATRSGGAYHRHSGGGGTDYTGGAFSEAQTEILVSGTVRIFALARSSSFSNTMNYAFALGNEIISGPEAAVLNTGVWELLDLGEFNGRGLIPLENDSSHRIDFAIEGNYSAGTLDLDAVLLLPIDNLIISRPFTGGGTTISGKEKKVVGGATTSFFSNDTVVRVAAHGEFWTVPPGNKMTRIVVNRYGTDNAHTLTSTSTVSFNIIPRTRHLLGTL